MKRCRFGLSFKLAQPVFLMRFTTGSSNGAAGIVHACCKDLNESHLRSAISFEVQHGYHNIHYRSMRFSNFLHSKLLHWCSQSNHFSTQKLLKESSEYSSINVLERSKILNEVSVLMGYHSIQDLIEQEKVRSGSNGDADDADGMMDDFDFTLARSRFPCIVLGDSSVIELYNEVSHPLLPGSYKNYVSYPVDGNWKETNRTLQFISPPISGIMSHVYEDGVSDVLLSDTRADLDGIAKSDAQVDSKKSSEAEWSSDTGWIPPLYLGQTGRSSSCKLRSDWPEENLDSRTKSEAQDNSMESSESGCINSLDTSLATQLFLGQTIRDLPNATRRQCRQLEDSGFHTVRKLLHHFPRTYADLQSVQGTIEDGHYLICVGTVLSSRVGN